MRSKLACLLVIPVALVMIGADVAHACPYCYGASDDPMAKGMNNGIMVLLGVIGSVQLGFVALFVAVWRRTKRYQERKDSFEVIDGGLH